LFGYSKLIQCDYRSLDYSNLKDFDLNKVITPNIIWCFDTLTNTMTIEDIDLFLIKLQDQCPLAFISIVNSSFDAQIKMGYSVETLNRVETMVKNKFYYDFYVSDQDYLDRNFVGGSQFLKTMSVNIYISGLPINHNCYFVKLIHPKLTMKIGLPLEKFLTEITGDINPANLKSLPLLQINQNLIIKSKLDGILCNTIRRGDVTILVSKDGDALEIDLSIGDKRVNAVLVLERYKNDYYFLHYRSICGVSLLHWPLKWHKAPVGVKTQSSFKLNAIDTLDMFIKIPCGLASDGVVIFDDNYGVKTVARMTSSNNQHYYKWVDMVDIKIKSVTYETFRMVDCYLPIRIKPNEKVDMRPYKQVVFINDLLIMRGLIGAKGSLEWSLGHQLSWMQYHQCNLILFGKINPVYKEGSELNIVNSIIAMKHGLKIKPIVEDV